MSELSEDENLPFCACGCRNRVTKKGNKYIFNHNWTGEDNKYRDEQAKRRIQYFKDHPEEREESSKRSLQMHKDNPQVGRDQSKRVKKRFEESNDREDASKKMLQFYDDNPEMREYLSLCAIERFKDPMERKKYSERMLQFYGDHPEVIDVIRQTSIKQFLDPKQRELQSKLKIQFYKDHPEVIEEMSQRAFQYYIDHPEIIEELAQIRSEFYNNTENCERASAAQMGQDYDAGEWTGFYVGDRSHVKPESRCVKLNERFGGCEMHHITSSIIIYIPKELHRHYIPHSLKTGKNMDIVNIVSLQYLNGCYDG